MKNFRAVIFDLDGTLCNTIDDLCDAMNNMLRICRYPELTKQQVLGAINCGATEFVRGCMPSPEKDDAEKLSVSYKLYDDYYNEHFCDKTLPYEGLPDAVATLRSHNFKTAVLSNKQDSHTKLIIERLFPFGSFDTVMGKSDRFPTKPDPSSALYIAESLGVTPDEVLYIGDSDVDMKTAKNAGMYALGVTWGYRSRQVLTAAGADALADTPSDIIKTATGR